MPATSRSGLRLRRRSGSDRAGSPSKSSITQSSPAQSVWPRWKSPCMADHPADAADVRRAGAGARAPPRRGRESGRASSRRRAARGRSRSISSSTVAVSSPSDSVDGSSGAKLGSVESQPSSVCICPVTSPSRRRLVEERLVARERSRRARAPSRPRPPATKRCRMPSVASIGAPGVRVPARELRDVLEAALGEEAQQLELGVDARPRAAGRPSGSARRRTRSTCSTARRSIGRAVAQLACRALRSRLDRARTRRRPRRPRTLRAARGSCARARAPGADRRARRAAPSGEQLVGLVRPGVEARSRRAAARAPARPRAARRGRRRVRVRDLARLRAEPALAR